MLLPDFFIRSGALRLICMIPTVCIPLLSDAQTVAFPGAEGYGAYAAGGRGGDVYVVTNLNSSGAGSFYQGLTTIPSNGRTIVFAVSGQIHLAGGIATRITGNKLTIAGQTAPGDGILLKDGTVRISGDDLVIRHLRFRHGKNGSGGDCIDLDSGCQNAILDHVSMAFSTDENISSYGSPPENLTMQWSFNAWGLESHSCGGLWDQNHASCHHTLWAHHHTRNPKARPSGLLEWVNNVSYDWDIGFIMGDSNTPSAWKANVRGNYFICPPGNIRSYIMEKGWLDRNAVRKPTFSIYLDNNFMDRNGDGVLNGSAVGYERVQGQEYQASEVVPSYTTEPDVARYYKNATPFAGSAAGVAIDSPLVAYKKIVSDAGPLRMDYGYTGSLRDEVDTRLIQNLTTQTANHISRESDLAGVSNGGFGTFNPSTAPIDTDKDGMPDHYEVALGWNPATQDHNSVVTGATYFPTGYPAVYTRLEEYLHFKAVPHLFLLKGTATPAGIDLTRYTSGFSNNPVFAVSNVTGGTVSQSGAGGRLVQFTANHVAGRGGFDFTVTDADGSTWTRRFAICITNSGAPADLNWRGTGAAWDSSSSNWLKEGAPALFSNGDRVSFSNAGAGATNVTLAASVLAAAMDVDASISYTFSGAGGISSTNALTKRGSGTLTFNNTASNSFSGISLDAGSLVLNQAGAGGSAKIAFNGGALTLAPAASSTVSNPLEFNQPSTVTVGSQHNQTGNWTGSQTVTVNGTSSHLWTVAGTWTGFTGKMALGTGNVRIRLNGNTNTNFGSPSVAVDLGSGTGQLMNRNGATIELGELSAAGASTVLSGTQTGTAASVYQVGGKNTDATFAGGIVNGGGTTGIIKVGTGAWTLSGTSSYTGSTTVSQGGLLVAGTLGNTAVSVSSGATVGGSGTIGGAVSLSAGGLISPGNVSQSAGTLTLSSGLTLNGATVICDLSDSPSGVSDRISVAGTLALVGTQTFQFRALQGALAAGTYDLVTATNSSASGVSLVHNLPTDSRQTFQLARSAAGSNPSKIWLTVTGNAATLTWTGATNGAWDTVTSGNWTGASPNTYYNDDAVWFTDTAVTRTVTLNGTLVPRTVSVTTNLGYTLNGAGSLGGAASLVKNGTGTLTLAGSTAHAFSGGITLNAGTIALANDTMNAGGLGSGVITLNGGTLSMYDNDSSYSSFQASLLVPTGATARLNADARVDVYGKLTGGGTLNYYVPWVRTSLFADWSDFTGTIQVLTDSSGGDFRMSSSYAYPGFPDALLSLSDKVWAYYTGILLQGAGTTIPIGALSGTSQSVLQGGPTGGRALTYRIGGRNTDAVFAGTISEQNASTATNYVKTGTGLWTLSGTGNWNGGTVVEQGTLKITGNMACAGSTQLLSGGNLRLEGGTLITESVNLAAGAGLSGWGTMVMDLNAEGILEGRGFSSGTADVLNLQGSAFFGGNSLTRLRGGVSSDRMVVDGDVALGGTIEISLAPGTGFGRYPLISCSGAISGTAALTGIPAGTSAKLSVSQNGTLDLVIDDQDEDGMSDTWEMANFGSLTESAAGDRDGDGSSNLVEFRLGLNPLSGSSMFRSVVSGRTISWPSAPGISFRVKRSVSLESGSWLTIATVVAGSGTVSSYTDPLSFPKAFYQVEFTP